MTRPRVVVLNQFAMPRDHWGLTRNAELFSRLEGWEPVIFAGDRDHYGQARMETTDPIFRLTAIPPYAGSSVRRVLGWLLFSMKGFLFAVRQPRLAAVYGSSPHLLAALAALAAARIRRVPFVMEVRDLWPESIVAAGMTRGGGLVHRALIRLEVLLYRAAAEIVLVTTGWEDHFDGLGIDRSKLTVISNGVDVDLMEVAEPRAALREEFGFAPDRLVAVYAGAHGAANGLDQLVDAARALPDVDVVLIGAGADKDRLRARVAKEGLHNVRFLDPVPKAELARLLAAADIGVHVLAPWELLSRGLSPNKVFDYMAAGLPVASNCRDGLSNVVADGECGRLTGPTDLLAALRSVAEASEETRLGWGSKGSQRVRDHYGRDAAATSLAKLLGSCVAAARGQA